MAFDCAADQWHLGADFGVQHLSMLGGITFFSHQLGSFMGIWLGGYLYDSQGNYDMLWYLMIVLGVAGALINLPVRETAIARPALATTPKPMTTEPTTPHICAPAPPDLAAGLGMAGGCAGLAGRVWPVPYPDFMLTIAEQTWACF